MNVCLFKYEASIITEPGPETILSHFCIQKLTSKFESILTFLLLENSFETS